MRQINFTVSSLESLDDFMQSQEMVSFRHFQSALIQIYSANNESEWYKSIGEAVRMVLPGAVVVGASSVGEINEGLISTNSTIIEFSFFESSSVDVFSYECKLGDEESAGKSLALDLSSVNGTKGVLILSTPVSNDSGKLFNILTESNQDYPVFGGGAGNYVNSRNTLVYDGTHCFKEGIVMAVLSGKDLFIESFTYLEWHPLSKEMTITDVGKMSVKTIDGKPAFSVYEKYLGIKADKYFFQNSLEFPFLIYRDGQIIARTPFFADENDGSIEMVADIRQGEKFRIGYGNPQMILAESAHIQQKMLEFRPEAIYLYSCICRRFLMQQDINLETLPFNRIAPTAGFYTFGEFCSNGTVKSLLNSTMVAVGIREGSNDEGKKDGEIVLNDIKSSDPYTNQHSRILSRLLYFINETTKELEAKNRELKSLNEQKNEFLGIAAHDLRNPIGIIRGFSELLEEQISDDLKEYTGEIIKVSSRMLHLLDDLLDISKIEAGKLNLNRSEMDYISFVNQNIKLNTLMANSKRIEILSDIKISHQNLSFDEGKIGQVLNNLIGNAIKYSYPDSAIVVKVFKENDNIVTQVIDYGQGIPESEINSLFHPFKQTSIKPTSGESSHGLGLAIVKKIIEGHNGHVGVTSNFGKGSVFYFDLPINYEKN